MVFNGQPTCKYPRATPNTTLLLKLLICLESGYRAAFTTIVLMFSCLWSMFHKCSFFLPLSGDKYFFGPGDPVPQRPNNPEIYVAPSIATTETSSDPTDYMDPSITATTETSSSRRTAPMPTFNYNYQFPFFTLSNPSLFSAIGGSYQPHNGSRIGSGSSQYEHLNHGLEGNSASNTHLHPPGSPRSHYDQAFSLDRNVLQQQQPAQQVQQAQLQQQAVSATTGLHPQPTVPPVPPPAGHALSKLLPPWFPVSHATARLQQADGLPESGGRERQRCGCSSCHLWTVHSKRKRRSRPFPLHTATTTISTTTIPTVSAAATGQYRRSAAAASSKLPPQQPEPHPATPSTGLQWPHPHHHHHHHHGPHGPPQSSRVDASQRNGTSVCGGHGHGPDASCAARPTDLKLNSFNSSTVPHFHLAQTPTVRNITEPVVFKRQRSRSTSAVDESEICDTLTPLPDFLPNPFQKSPPLLRQKSMSADNIPVLCINGCRVFSPQKETLSPFKSPNAASNPNRNMVQGQQQQAQPQFQPPPVFTSNQQFLLYLHQLVMHSPNCPLPGCPCRTLQHDFNKLMAYQKVAVESANAAVAAAATSGQYFTYAPNVNGVPGPSPYTQQEAAIYSTDELYAHCKYGLYGKSN